MDKICPNYSAWDDIWGGRINIDPGYTFESGSETIPSCESRTKPASDVDADIEGDEELLVSRPAGGAKSSKKRNYWSQSSNDIISLRH